MTNYVAGVSATLHNEELEAGLWRAVDYWRARARLTDGNIEGAESLVTHHIEKSATADFLVLRAQLHWQQSNSEAAFADLDEALSIDDHSVDAHLWKAKIKSFDRSLDEARAHLENHFRTRPA